MVNRRLREKLEADGRLGHRQHAFRPGYGTSTYFANLGSVLQEAYEEGKHVDLVSLDIAKAFSRTWTPLVLRKLQDWGITGNMLAFIKNFLSRRTFQVLIGGTASNEYPEETGVPQGSVLAVTLFLIAMDGVFNSLPANVYVFVYADDILLVVVGSTPEEPELDAQRQLSPFFGGLLPSVLYSTPVNVSGDTCAAGGTS
ncbi:uncharacterized protein LOC134206203 [Armigeres subalbatus]|uniref:uncharacterized protein LOC134206203 n=1 Tax=Armigeres subalbatus TaxID=124917 RepID=UPI002ED2A449